MMTLLMDAMLYPLREKAPDLKKFPAPERAIVPQPPLAAGAIQACAVTRSGGFQCPRQPHCGRGAAQTAASHRAMSAVVAANRPTGPAHLTSAPPAHRRKQAQRLQGVVTAQRRAAQVGRRHARHQAGLAGLQRVESAKNTNSSGPSTHSVARHAAGSQQAQPRLHHQHQGDGAQQGGAQAAPRSSANRPPWPRTTAPRAGGYTCQWWSFPARPAPAWLARPPTSTAARCAARTRPGSGAANQGAPHIGQAATGRFGAVPRFRRHPPQHHGHTGQGQRTGQAKQARQAHGRSTPGQPPTPQQTSARCCRPPAPWPWCARCRGSGRPAAPSRQPRPRQPPAAPATSSPVKESASAASRLPPQNQQTSTITRLRPKRSDAMPSGSWDRLRQAIDAHGQPTSRVVPAGVLARLQGKTGSTRNSPACAAQRSAPG